MMFLHGSQQFENEIYVEQPPIRDHLIERGYAWAASSFDRNVLITGIAADETAQLWNFFASRYGAPQRTYVIGGSMGGAGAIISAERYADRYSGVLALCPIAGLAANYDTESLYFVAAAYAAGVTQDEFESSEIQQLLVDRIRPALSDPEVKARFVSLWVALTGGPRPYASEGLSLSAMGLEALSELEINSGKVDNAAIVYALRGADGVTDEDFNRNVIRITAGKGRASIPATEEMTGDINIPVVTLNATGDGLVPISEAQTIRKTIASAARGNLLVQRTVQAAGHCSFTKSEMVAAFEALVSWSTDGVRPAGENLEAPNLSTLGADFTEN